MATNKRTRSSFLNRFPSLLISSASKLVAISNGRLDSLPMLKLLWSCYEDDDRDLGISLSLFLWNKA
jgi:hypothetical protein